VREETTADMEKAPSHRRSAAMQQCLADEYPAIADGPIVLHPADEAKETMQECAGQIKNYRSATERLIVVLDDWLDKEAKSNVREALALSNTSPASDLSQDRANRRAVSPLHSTIACDLEQPTGDRMSEKIARRLESDFKTSDLAQLVEAEFRKVVEARVAAATSEPLAALELAKEKIAKLRAQRLSRMTATCLGNLSLMACWRKP